MELDPWGSMPHHVLCKWQLDGNWNAKWSIFRCKKIAIRHNKNIFLIIRIIDTFTVSNEVYVTSIQKNRFKTKSESTRICFFSGVLTIPTRGFWTLNGWYVRITQYENAFMISNRSLIFSSRLISLHHSCEWLNRKAWGLNCLFMRKLQTTLGFLGGIFGAS